MNLDKYKNCLIKLTNSSMNTEVWGYLHEHDGGDLITVKDAIMVVNKYVADPARTLYDIIKYEFDISTGTSVTTPFSPLFDNSGDGSVVILSLNSWILNPIHTTSFEKLKDKADPLQVDTVTVMGNYIKDVFDNFRKTTSEILNADTTAIDGEDDE